MYYLYCSLLFNILNNLHIYICTYLRLYQIILKKLVLYTYIHTYVTLFFDHEQNTFDSYCYKHIDQEDNVIENRQDSLCTHILNLCKAL